MSDEQGVPKDEVTAKDHIQVRPKLVKRLGGANNALVWSRIYFRADDLHREAVEIDGSWWWPASMPKLSTETGLTEKQVRLALDELIDDGYLVRRPAGKSFMYQPVIAAKTYLPSGADSGSEASALKGGYIGPVGQTHLPSGAVTPLIDLEDVEDTPVAPRGGRVDIAFERAWEAWIPARRGSRKKAESSFRTAAKTVGSKELDRLLRTIEAHCDAWKSWAPSEHRYAPMLATWLNQERWLTPVPERDRGRASGVVEHGRAVHELLREREQSAGGKAIAS